MSANFVLAHSDLVQEITKYFTNPAEVAGMLVTCWDVYKTWKPYFQKILSIYKLQQVIFVRPYFPSKMNVFDIVRKLNLPDTVTFNGKVIGKVNTHEYNWSTEYLVVVFTPKPIRLKCSVQFKGLKLNFLGYGGRVYASVKTNKADAVNMCKAIYCYLYQF